MGLQPGEALGVHHEAAVEKRSCPVAVHESDCGTLAPDVYRATDGAKRGGDQTRSISVPRLTAYGCSFSVDDAAARRANLTQSRSREFCEAADQMPGLVSTVASAALQPTIRPQGRKQQ